MLYKYLKEEDESKKNYEYKRLVTVFNSKTAKIKAFTMTNCWSMRWRSIAHLSR